MLINKTFAAIVIIVSLFADTIAQQSTPKLSGISPELKKNAVEFLRETIKEIPNLKAEENRQYFMIQTAGLLWEYDQQQSRAMFTKVADELKSSISKVVQAHQNEVIEIKKKIKENPRLNAVSYGTNRVVNAVGNAVNSVANVATKVEPTIGLSETGLIGAFSRISILRKKMLEDTAYTEPLMAYKFYVETNKLLPKEIDGFQDGDYRRNVDALIVGGLLAKGEVEKAVDIARIALDGKNRSEDSWDILSDIYGKNAVMGSKLAEEVLAKTRTSKDTETIHLSGFFDVAFKHKNSQPPLLTEKSFRELAKLLGESVLAGLDKDYYYSNPYDYAKKIKDFAPRQALLIVQKAKKKKNLDYYPSNAVSNAAGAVANAINAASKAADAAANASKSKGKKKIQPAPPSPPKDEWEIKAETKKELLQLLVKGNFASEQRKDIIKKAKDFAYSSYRAGFIRPEGFTSIVAELARFSLFSADKEVSEELMKEAEIYVRPETKTMFDYLGKLMLAGGYSAHHPEKSFVIMESLTPINDVIEHAVKLGTFIDFTESFVPNDEVSAAFFLGEFGLTRELTRENELPIFIQNLAKADFKRTTRLADKFVRSEFKMTAKMLILESLIGEFSEPVPKSEDIEY